MNNEETKAGEYAVLALFSMARYNTQTKTRVNHMGASSSSTSIADVGGKEGAK